MKRRLFPMLFVACVQAVTANDLSEGQIACHIVDGAGWQTSLTLVNLANQSTPYKLSFFASNGSSWALTIAGAGSSGTLQGTLAPYASVTYETAAVEAVTRQGYAVVVEDPGFENIAGFAVFRQSASGRSNQEATVPLAPASGGFAIAFDNTRGYVTAVALVNAEDEEAELRITILDEGGKPIGAPALLLSVPARAHMSFALPAQLPATSGRRGVVNFEHPTGLVTGLGLRFSPGGAFTTIPVVTLDEIR